MLLCSIDWRYVLTDMVQNWHIDLESSGPPLQVNQVHLRRSSPGLWRGFLGNSETPHISCFISARGGQTALKKACPATAIHLFTLNHIGRAPLAELCFVAITAMKENDWYHSCSHSHKSPCAENELQTFNGPINVHWTITMPFITSVSVLRSLCLCSVDEGRWWDVSVNEFGERVQVTKWGG